VEWIHAKLDIQQILDGRFPRACVAVCVLFLKTQKPLTTNWLPLVTKLGKFGRERLLGFETPRRVAIDRRLVP
jgi:hypothetical protein